MDAGRSWRPVVSGTGAHLMAVAFLDGRRGVAVGLYGTTLVSADAGASWSAENAGTRAHLRSVTFAPDGSAVAVGWLGTIVHRTWGAEAGR
jgi:photosystem II stability/assembly factor-like uncharacterized protein